MLILRSTTIAGGASILNVLIGLIRLKVAALILGPAGIGLVGLLNNLVNTAASAAALGVGTVGTRQVADASRRDDELTLATTRQAMLWGALLLSFLGALIFWLLRDILAQHILSNPSLSSEIGWLALGVGFTVFSSAQAALLNGLRLVADLARLSVYSAVLSTCLGLAALLIWQQDGLIVFLLAVPIARFAVGHFYVYRLPKMIAPRPAILKLKDEWLKFAKLGGAFLLAGLATTGGELIVRSILQRELGIEAVGCFEAAWVISMTYLGFVLAALGIDYYPRLTSVINNPEVSNELINQQTEIVLLLSSPVILFMLGFAPLIIILLYSSSFMDSAVILQWQIMGDILKIASWPLGFMVLARADGRAYFLLEAMAASVFIFFTWLCTLYLKLSGMGIAFFLMYLVYLPVTYAYAVRQTNFRWSKKVKFHLLVLFLFGGTVFLTARWNSWAGMIVGAITSLMFLLYAAIRLNEMMEVNNPIVLCIKKIVKACFFRAKNDQNFTN